MTALAEFLFAPEPRAVRRGRRSDPGTSPNATINMGEIFLARGALDLTREHLDSVLRYSREPTTSEWMRFRYSIRLFVGLGEVALRRGETALAREHAAQGRDLATRTGSRKNLVKAGRLSGEIATDERRWEEAEAALRQVLGFAEAIANPPQLWRTHAAIARFHAARGRADSAREARARARAGRGPRSRDSRAPGSPAKPARARSRRVMSVPGWRPQR